MTRTHTHFSLAAGLAFAGLVTASGAGETITVTTIDDSSDTGFGATVASLPGPDGRVSFREAVTAANNTAGPQTIAFAIPQAEWAPGNQAVLRLEDGAFLIQDDETTVDFLTQTAFTGDTNPNGGEVGIYGFEPNAWGVAAIFVFADDCVIRGLDRVLQRGYGVEVVGDRNRVVGCTISGPLYAGVMVQGNVGDPATDNVIGGTAPEDRNVLSAGNAGIRVDGPTQGTVVIGNTLVGSPFAGVQVRGAYCCPEYTPYGTRIGGPTSEEANWIADNGKFGEEGFPLGTQVQVEWAVDTVVEGNVIGTTQAGDARFPGASGTVGVGVRESQDTTIRGNLVSGMRKVGVNHYAGEVFGTAISVFGPNTGVVIRGNRIGTDAAGLGAIPNLNGIVFSWFQGYPEDGAIGGPASGDGNLIAYNEAAGVFVPNVADVTIAGNAIHSNVGLGIDLVTTTGGAGVTPNDPGDTNGLQNFPVVESALAGSSSLRVTGRLDSHPGEAFTVELFASADCDASGHGEGEIRLGTVALITDAGGLATFDVELQGAVAPGSAITATATRTATGQTSEFSACRTAESDPMPEDLDHDQRVGFGDLVMLLSQWGTCPACSADLTGDGTVGFADLIRVLSAWSA